MQRVMIIGQPGSGKSTLARAIGAKTGLPVFHMDQLHWQSGWVERPKSEKIAMATEIENQEQWAFEGNFSATYAHRLARADTLIVLELPVGLRLRRVVRRTLASYGQTRPDLPPNCPERFSAEFLIYIWRTRRTGRIRLHDAIAAARPEQRVVRLDSPRAMAAFLRGL